MRIRGQVPAERARKAVDIDDMWNKLSTLIAHGVRGQNEEAILAQLYAAREALDKACQLLLTVEAGRDA